jgi:hypothetical protein
VDLSGSTGLFAFRPHEAVLAADQLERVIDLLGRRCVKLGEQARAARTLVPLVRRLVGSRRSTGTSTTVALPCISFGQGTHRELTEATIAQLGVELLLALDGGRVRGAAILTKTGRARSSPGFIVLQLIAVEEAVERTGVGSRILDAACAVAADHDEKGSLLVPATSKWWGGASKEKWLHPVDSSECEELSRMPYLFRMADGCVLRWACGATRCGWLHGGTPLPPERPSQPSKATKPPPQSLAATKSSPAAPPPVAQRPEKEKTVKVTLKPWWAALPEEFKPPLGDARHFESDTQRRGVDGRLWRSVDIYGSSGQSVEKKRKKLCTAWMPLDQDQKLIKPPDGGLMLPAS